MNSSGGNTTNAHSLATSSNTMTPLAALGSGTLGVGWSGSGFLIFYFTGVVSVLQALGVIGNTTKLAGSSGGAITSAAVCSGISAQEQLATNLALAARCRPTAGCRGSLDAAVRASLEAVLPPDAAERCRGELWVTVTEARPANKTDEALVLTSFDSRAELIDAVAASAFLPNYSARSPVTRLANATTLASGGELNETTPVYDGGFSFPLPCPPDVSYCLRVAAQAPTTPQQQAAALHQSMQLLAASTAQAADNATAAYLPLNPGPVPSAKPDIFPGLSGSLPANMTAVQWNSFSLLLPPSNATLLAEFNQGRLDAAAFVTEAGLAGEARVQQALAETEVTTGF